MNPRRETPARHGAPVERLAAERLLGQFREASRVRGAAVLGADGHPLAATGAPEAWAAAATRLLEVADDAGGAPAAHVHVGTGDGEVFALRGAELAIVVVARRSQLASLMLSDMRALLDGLENRSASRDDLFETKTPSAVGSEH